MLRWAYCLFSPVPYYPSNVEIVSARSSSTALFAIRIKKMNTQLNTLKGLQVWVKTTIVLTIAYLALFEMPRLWSDVEWVWAGVRSASLPTISIGVVQLVVAVFDTVIWLASVCLAGRGFLVTKKPAYAFLLAYLLLCTVTAPLSYAVKKLSYAYSQHQMANISDEQWAQFQNAPVQTPSAVAVVPRKMNLPIGPILLLLALSCLCQADGIRMANKLFRIRRKK